MSVAQAFRNFVKLFAGSNMQAMPARVRRQPIVIPENNPVAKERYALQKRRAANQAARAKAVVEANDVEECDGFALTRIQLL